MCTEYYTLSLSMEYKMKNTLKYEYYTTKYKSTFIVLKSTYFIWVHLLRSSTEYRVV